MDLSAEAKRRLADIVELQPTKNSELQHRWGLDSGSAVHQYLEAELKEYYYRDDQSLIRATPDAVDLIDPADGDRTVTVRPLANDILSVLAGLDDRSQSVVSVLQDLRAEHDTDPSTDELRRQLQQLADRGLVEVIHRSVPTYRLAVDPATVDIEVTTDS